MALNPFLNKVVVPTGAIDLARDLPPADVVLLAAKASLVVRNDVHTALQYMLLAAASQIHGHPGIFQKAGEFPAPEMIDLPLSRDANRFYRSGLPFFQRYLPILVSRPCGAVVGSSDPNSWCRLSAGPDSPFHI